MAPRCDRYYISSVVLFSFLTFLKLDQCIIAGVVIGVDEESACCWLVCGTCENADITIKQKARYVLISTVPRHTPSHHSFDVCLFFQSTVLLFVV